MHKNLGITLGIVLSALMMLSAVGLTYRWFLVLHSTVDPWIVVFAFTLTLSLGLLLINVLLVMFKTIDEIESSKRIVSIGYKELEERIDKTIAKYMRDVEKEMDEIKRRMYR